MIDVQERNEKASALIVAGWVACLFNALIFFFLPSALRTGHHLAVLAVMSVLVVVGLVLIVAGYAIRGRSAIY